MYLNNCILFLAGIILALAYDDLSSKQEATHYMTMSYPQHLYEAGYAVDRNTSTCSRTDDIGETSPYTYTWWKVNLGGVYNIYSVNIVFKNYDNAEYRQRGRFAGFSLYVSTTGDMDNSSLCYKDGPKLPPLSFTTTCTTYGRYMIYYNERLRGVTYPEGYQSDNVPTELCEVTVLGCRGSGVYGSNCDVACPPNCRDNVCHIQEGTCFGCAPGWTGTKCDTECTGGWYGVNCKHQCSGSCRDNAVCNHVTGQCDKGCAAGRTGPQCDIECADGTYGNNCSYQCSENCLNDSTCNKQTGHCIGGCKPGCTQSLCNEPCKVGYYGSNCSQVCYGNCKTCKHTDVTCRSCFAGWMGPNCTIGCVWSHGEDCKYPCNKHCVNQTCDRVNGSCLSGCDSGFYGPKCDQEHVSTSSSDSHLSALSSGLLGAFVSAFAFLTTAAVVYDLRTKMLSRHETKSSPYAEVENHQSGDSTYQELTVKELDKAYQNLALQ